MIQDRNKVKLNTTMFVKYLVPSMRTRGLLSVKRGPFLARYYNDIKSTSVRTPNSRYRLVKSPEEIAKEKFEEQLNSPNRFIRWGAIARTDTFRKSMTKYLIGLYSLFLLYGLQHMKKLYNKEKELEVLQEKNDKEEANEYEQLKLKSFKGKMRTRDVLKLDKYEEMKKGGTVDFDGIVLNTENHEVNKSAKQILPARDTTQFYDQKAIDYDNDVDFEEKMIFMGKRRKWLMRHCKGDVLEVSCGTGRNIKYLDASRIHSITYIDSSKKMIELARHKFKDYFPNFGKAAFVVGKAENLIQLAAHDQKDLVQYDTIIQTFGLCSHENPVKALENFSTLLKPGGRIILLEHGRGEYNFINKILDDRAEKRLSTWGCRWNLDIGEILDDSGLDIVQESRTHFGTTWCIVAKRKGDVKAKDEIGFFEKYVRSGVKNKLEHMKEHAPKIPDSTTTRK